jgi:hypothetical protein
MQIEIFKWGALPADAVANQRLRFLDCSPLILNFNLQ